MSNGNPNFFLTTLAQSLSAGGSDTEIYVSSITTLDGTVIQTSDFAEFGRGILTIDPQSSSRTEFVSFTGVSSGDVAFTGTIRGLSFNSNTSVSANKHFHAVGAQVIISFGTHNILDMISVFAAIGSAETITGLWTFTTSPVVPDPTLGTQAANKEYVDNVTVSGAPNANTTTKGIVQEATQAQMDAGTTSGSTGADLYPTPALIRSKQRSDYVADTGSTNAYAIAPSPAISAYAAGQTFTFLAGNTNTGASTLAVSSLATKNIYKPQGGNIALTGGEIMEGQIVEVMYDGTEFQMLSTAATVYAIPTFGGTGTDGALSITSGTTTLSASSAATIVKNYSSISITGTTGKLAFSNPATNGTTIILLSSGNVTITSTASPAIDASGMGAAGGSGASASGGNSCTGSGGGGASVVGSGSAGTNAACSTTGWGAGTDGSAALGIGRSIGGRGAGYSDPYTTTATNNSGFGGLTYGFTSTLLTYAKMLPILPGSGGGGGGGCTTGTSSGGAGGAGGGAIYIECGGAYDCTATVSAAGKAGSNGGSTYGGGGGGGGGGVIIILYVSLTADSGTYTVTGGAGGTGGSSFVSDGTGGAGATGLSIVEKNVTFS